MFNVWKNIIHRPFCPYLYEPESSVFKKGVSSMGVEQKMLDN